MTDVVAVVAARDEAERIEGTVRALLGIPGVARVVVADDGSRDDTAALASAAGAAVTRRPRPLGKGSALEAGIEMALATGRPRALLLADADLGPTAASLAPLLGPVLDGTADLAIATFPAGAGGGGFGMVKRSARWAIARLSGYRAAEPLSGQRAISVGALREVRPIARGFGAEAAMTVDAARAGLRIVELPCVLSHRRTGRTAAGFLHRGRQALHIAVALVPRAVPRRRGRS